MRVVRFDDVPAADWDAFCDASPDAWLFHRSSWIRLEEALLGRRSHSFALIDGEGHVEACLPLYLLEVGLGPFTERLLAAGSPRIAGPAFRAPSPSARARGALMTELFRLATELSADRIQLAVNPLAPAALTPGLRRVPFWIQGHGFHAGLALSELGQAPAPGMATCQAEQLVELGRPLQEIFEAFETNGRQPIRKAERAGVTLERGTDTGLVEVFRGLAGLSAQRTGQSSGNDLCGLVRERFAADGRCLIIIARHQGRPAAGVLLAIDKAGMSFMAGASDPTLMSLGVNDLVQWGAIQAGAELGLAYYRLGPWFPSLPRDWPISKVSRFKAKFASVAVELVCGSYFLRPGRYREIGAALLEKLCRTDAPSSPPG
jgi:hypothetical protein